MEILLLIIAGAVLYYLYNGFQDYMKNPYKIEDKEQYKREYNIDDTPYMPETEQDRIKKTEYGILTMILKCIASVDGEVCKLEQELLKDMLDDIANELVDYKNARILLQEIFDSSNEDLDDLANKFASLTKGEYKKRLKVIEFLFAVAYADECLSDLEREKIIDVAAIFELNNDDFNKLYDDFESEYSHNIEMDKQKALEILGLGEDYTKDDLENAYSDKIKENKQNVLLNKNLNKDFNTASTKILRDIDSAYKILLLKFT